MPELQNLYVCSAGMKGRGKSSKARELLQDCSRLFCFDTTGEHRWIPDRFDDLQQATIYLMETPTFPNFQGAYIPEGEDDDADFLSICDTVYDQGNMTFFIEEVVMLGCSAQFTPKKFRKVIRLGRHRNLNLFYTAQRIGECSRLLTSQTDIFILFAQAEPSDLDAISKRCGAETARKVAAFSDHEFLIYDVNRKAEIDEKTLLRILAPMLGAEAVPR